MLGADAVVPPSLHYSVESEESDLHSNGVYQWCFPKAEGFPHGNSNSYISTLGT